MIETGIKTLLRFTWQFLSCTIFSLLHFSIEIWCVTCLRLTHDYIVNRHSCFILRVSCSLKHRYVLSQRSSSIRLLTTWRGAVLCVWLFERCQIHSHTRRAKLVYFLCISDTKADCRLLLPLPFIHTSPCRRLILKPPASMSLSCSCVRQTNKENRGKRKSCLQSVIQGHNSCQWVMVIPRNLVN